MNLPIALQTISKALAGAIGSALVVFLAKHNIVIADDLNDAIEVILGAIVTFAVVYFSPANKTTETK